MYIVFLIVNIFIFIVFAILGFLVHKKYVADLLIKFKKEKSKSLKLAKKEADQMVQAALNEASVQAKKRIKIFEKESEKRRQEILKLENKVKSREYNLDKKLEIVEQKDFELNTKKLQLEKQYKKLNKSIKDYELSLIEVQNKLQRIAKISVEEAKMELVSLLEKEARAEAQESIKKIEEEIKTASQSKSKYILSSAMQRAAGEYVNDICVSVVNLPDDEMKGRIIGREGRNIRSIEQETGVDIIIDDTPKAVILSCFNANRREIAKISIERLIIDGRIHPARIKETVDRVKKDIHQIIYGYGEEACFEVGITDMPSELIQKIGALKFITNGHQSVLQHSIETAQISSVIAYELNVNPKHAKLAGLLHDVGKGEGHEQEGHHAHVSAHICKNFDISQSIIDAIYLHHNENLKSSNLLTVILDIANKMSNNRPGIKKDKISAYLNRLEDMEKIASSFDGVLSSHVFQAGKEIKVLINSEDLTDDDATIISQKISLAFREKLSFPGNIKIIAIRESEYTDIAT